MKHHNCYAATSVAAFFWAILGLLGSSVAAASANLGVAPLSLTLPAKNLATSLELTNVGNKPVTMQAEVFTWQQKDGKDVLTPTRELFVSPPIFRIAAGKPQIVRIGRLKPELAGELEKTYRVHLTEVPDDAEIRENNLTTVLKLNLPLRVPAAKKQEPRLDWTATRGSGDQLTLNVQNPTNGYVKLLGFSLLQGGEVIASKEQLFYVLAGASRSYVWDGAMKLAKPGIPVELQARLTPRKSINQMLNVGAVTVVPK